MNTRNVWISASGANPGHDASCDATTPATNVPWPSPSCSVSSCVQFERSFTSRKCGWSARTPVSNTPIFTPFPEKPFFHKNVAPMLSATPGLAPRDRRRSARRRESAPSAPSSASSPGENAPPSKYPRLPVARESSYSNPSGSIPIVGRVRSRPGDAPPPPPCDARASADRRAASSSAVSARSGLEDPSAAALPPPALNRREDGSRFEGPAASTESSAGSSHASARVNLCSGRTSRTPAAEATARAKRARAEDDGGETDAPSDRVENLRVTSTASSSASSVSSGVNVTTAKSVGSAAALFLRSTNAHRMFRTRSRARPLHLPASPSSTSFENVP